ncbi:AraC-like DNA-binding protein [Larkinella arboricola]|uniref:AraC-like DNA-binding protein n=1 Tax=Larkinella arboricola TaxID=643671 RepID=A0A327WQ74_LARAB|nr:helix-turn-helix domain-containing protein [Larkinella arboricola]RAJ93057.1 AraC-like DNA-binding protein [Larkinella arboricola]
MVETKGLLNQIKHHDRLPITVNQNCAVPLPETVWPKLLQPHRLAYYYFVFVDQGLETFQVDGQQVTIADSQIIFGTPNQIFAHPSPNKDTQQYKIGFDGHTLTLLPQAYPFLLNPLNTSTITFEPEARARVKAVLSMLFQLLHSPGKPKKVDIILAHLNALLTEFNSAYFEHHHQPAPTNPKFSKYVAFTLAVETNLTEQHDVHTIAKQLAMTPNNLYGVVKEFSGLSPKEWIINRLIQEAQRKLHYSSSSVKELAYELGFNDPAYFSRLFKKRTGKNVSDFLADQHSLSSK